MKFKGKLIGSILGLAFFGPMGLALGFIAGHLYDLGYFRAMLGPTQGGPHTHAQQVFFNNTFKVMGYIAKSDGHVSEKEIQTARAVMSQMGLDDTLKQQAIALFNLGKQPDFNIDAALQEIRNVCQFQLNLLRLFLEIQFQMASVEGLTPAKKATLQHICANLGVSGFQFHDYDNFYGQQKQYQRQHYQSSRADSFTLNDAYQTLGVTQNNTPDEIKKAYRRLMSQNHPDKLIAKGLPPEMIKVATQKTQRIKKAYEMIKASRG